MTVAVHQGDCLDVLPGLAEQSVHTCITSPPYFGLRSYLPDEDSDKALELGTEADPLEYVRKLVKVFRQVRRVLRNDGTLWVNIGDSYAANAGGRGGDLTGPDGYARPGRQHRQRSAFRGAGIKSKDLMMIPARLALALQEDGWFLRSSIIWAKAAPMPESVHDRPASAYEHVFLLSKRGKYYYDGEAIREESPALRGSTQDEAEPPSTRNARNVWHLRPEPYTASAHFATMPTELAARCIMASTSDCGCCPKCGAPWSRIVVKGDPDLAAQRAAGGDAGGRYTGRSRKGHDGTGVQNASDVKRSILAGMRYRRTAGWRPGCQCKASHVEPCTVLDPFAGVGTTGLAADRLRRNAVLVELHGDHAQAARRRIAGEAPLFAVVT